MAGDDLERAALNNAHWCEAVCAAHGRPGEFGAGLWLNRLPTPRFHPNAVTLSAGGAPAQQRQIVALARAGMAGEWGVKDSFSVLELAPLGFRLLFEAQWLRRPATLPPPRPEAEVGWARAGTAAELEVWEAAWAAASGDPGPRLFPPALLGDAGVAFVAVRRGGRLLGGAAANLGGGVVGLTNFFAEGAEADGVRRACIAAAAELYPRRAIVGYDSGGEGSALEALGFEPLGPLRVWVRV